MTRRNKDSSGGEAKTAAVKPSRRPGAYDGLVGGIADLLEEARRTSARALNAFMTATYWEIGRRIIEYEQEGARRAEYGEVLLKKLAVDLTTHYGRGFGWRNLFQMRAFYLAYPPEKLQTVSAISGLPPVATPGNRVLPLAVSAEPALGPIAACFRLPWSAYVRLLSVKDEYARHFYETEALRNGWSVRQLDRQIQSQFYERTALSGDKAAMLRKGARPQPEDAVEPKEEIKDPYVLQLGQRDYEERCYVQPLDHEDNLDDIRRSLKQAYGQFAAEEWIVNLTGGTKPMSIAAYEFLRSAARAVVVASHRSEYREGQVLDVIPPRGQPA